MIIFTEVEGKTVSYQGKNGETILTGAFKQAELEGNVTLCSTPLELLEKLLSLADSKIQAVDAQFFKPFMVYSFGKEKIITSIELLQDIKEFKK